MTLAIHYPKPENRQDILDAMKKINEVTYDIPGLVIDGAWLDEKGDRIIAMALWDSKEAADVGWEKVKPIVINSPLSLWERQPRDLSMFGIPRVV